MTVASEIREDETPPEGASPRTRPHRARVAAAFAVIGLLASVVGALGPSKTLHATYTWPTNAPTQAKKPRSFWYTPLLLERWTPQVLSARLPCSKAAPALSPSGRTVEILATARHATDAGGLSVVRSGDRMTVAIGTSTLAHVPVDTQAPNGTCSYTLRLAGDRFSIEGGSLRTPLAGTIASMPVVNGLFTGLDLGARPGLSVAVETQTFKTTPVLRQTIAWVVAALAILAALALVSFERRPKPWRTAKRLARDGVRNARPVDAVVVAALASWWILSPAFYDDGWVWVRGELYSSVGGFSGYFTGNGSNLPNDYWLEWLQHWPAQMTDALVFLRIPALVCLCATWVICRWIFARILASSFGDRPLALWTLGAAFLAGALSWGMTLRPEFATSLIAVGVLACVFRFLEAETAAPLALAAVFIPLAVTAHHAGAVSIAPLIVVAPALVSWARRRFAEVATLLVLSCATFVFLVFIGSDVQQRRLDARAAHAYLAGTSWLDEIQRYASVSSGPYGAPLRGASVALMWLAIVAYLLRSRRNPSPLLDVPARTLAVGLLLLVPLPDKLIWHFGGLVGFAALAIAAESARLRADGEVAGSWQARPFIVIGAGLGAAAWIWAAPQAWSILDLRTLDWSRVFERLQIGSLVVVAPLVLMIGASIVGIARRDPRPWRVPWRVAPWTAVVVLVPLFVFTLGVLMADAIKTPSWTLTRQNLEQLSGGGGCGMADDYAVALPESAQPLRRLAGDGAHTTPNWVPRPPSNRLSRFALSPSVGGSGQSPWFRVPTGKQVGIYVAGVPSSSDSLKIVWGSSGRRGVHTLAAGELDVPGAPVAESNVKIAELGNAPWRLFSAPELPTAPSAANALKITFVSRALPGSAVAVTTPVQYTSAPLASLIGRTASALVMPPLVMYMPCAREPALKRGVASVPRYIVTNFVANSTVAGTVVKYPTSPFLGLIDLYSVSYLPVANQSNPIRSFVVFRVNRTIPGAVELPPSVTTSS